MLLVADQVIVHEKDRLAPAQVVEGIQLGQDLGGCLDPRHVPEQGGDVTEFAIERAAARVLDSHGGIEFAVGQLPHRHW